MGVVLSGWWFFGWVMQRSLLSRPLKTTPNQTKNPFAILLNALLAYSNNIMD
jgi:hypothetical protein